MGSKNRTGATRRLAARGLRRAVGAAVALCMGLVAAPVPAADASKVLNVYNWSDYIGENTIRDFEKESGIKVHYDTFDSNEGLHAKLRAGHTGYDIVVPSSHWAKRQIEGGLLLKLDRSKITTFGNLDPWLMGQLAVSANDPGNQYIVPWLWGMTTVGINVDKVKAALGTTPMPDDAWDLLFKPEYASKLKRCGVSLLDSGDEVFPAAMHYLGRRGFSHDRADYEAAAKLLTSVRPYITLFSSSGYINELADGSLCVAMGWNGDIGIAGQRAKEAKNGQKIRSLCPSPAPTVLRHDGDPGRCTACRERLQVDELYLPAGGSSRHREQGHAQQRRCAPAISCSRPTCAASAAVPQEEELARVSPPERCPTTCCACAHGCTLRSRPGNDGGQRYVRGSVPAGCRIPGAGADRRRAFSAVDRLTKRFDEVAAVDDVSISIAQGRDLRPARLLRLRQVDPAAHAGRVRDPDLGHHLPRRHEISRPAAVTCGRST